MIAFREHPPVPAWDDAELDPRGALVVGPRQYAPRHVPLERDAADDPVAETRDARDEAVRAVGADEEGGTYARVTHAGRHALVLELELGNGDAVAEVGSRRGGLLREMEVKPAALRHRDQRRAARPVDHGPVSGA